MTLAWRDEVHLLPRNHARVCLHNVAKMHARVCLHDVRGNMTQFIDLLLSVGPVYVVKQFHIIKEHTIFPQFLD